MNFKMLVLASVAAVVLVSPAAAFADPEWGGDGGGWEHPDRDGGLAHDRDDDWRRQEWREHEHWGHRWGDQGDEWAHYAPRCYWRNAYYQSWWGQYEVRRVQICR